MASHLGRDFLGIELNPEYAAMAERRIAAGYKPKRVTRRRRDLAGQLRLWPAG